MDNREIQSYVENVIAKVKTLFNFLEYIVCVRKIIKKITWIFTVLFIFLIISKYPLKQDKNTIELAKPVQEIFKNIKMMWETPETFNILIIFFTFFMLLFAYFRPKGNKYFYKRILSLALIVCASGTTLFILKNPLNIGYYLFFAIFIAFQDIIAKFFEVELKSSNNAIIFKSRNSKAKYLTQLINTNNKNLILIDGMWGIGKTHFVEKTIEDEFKYNYVIKIDVLLFNDRNHMIEYTLNEINSVLIREGIRTKTLKEYGKLIKTVSKKMPLNLDVWLNPLSVEEIEKNIEKHLNQLNKKIFLIVDNVERIIEESKKIDILGFLHKIYDLKDKKINTIVLADSIKLNGYCITEEYLEKFFINRIELKSLDKYEILEAFQVDGKISDKIHSFLIEVYTELDLKLNYSSLERIKNEVTIKILKKWKSLNNYLENPRNIEHIIARINEKSSQDNHIVSKKNGFDEVEYFKTIVLVEVYRSEIDENIFNLTIEDLLKGFSIENLKDDLNFCNYFLTLTFFWEKKNELGARNKYFEVKARAIMRIIHSLENSEEAKIIKKVEDFSSENIAKWSSEEVDNYLPSFIKYAEYLDSEGFASIIYRNILWHKIYLLKDKELILNYKIFELDKENSETEKSILEILTFDISYKSKIEELLINSYQNEIFHFIRTKYSIYEISNDLKSFVLNVYNKYERTEFLDFFDVIKEIIRKTTEKKYEIIIREFLKMIKKYEMISYENNYDLEYKFILINEKTVEWKKSLNLLEESGTANHFDKEWIEFNEIKKMIENTFLELWDVAQKSFYRIKINDTVEIIENFINSLDSIFFKVILNTIPDNENVIKLFNLNILSTLMGNFEYFNKKIYEKIEKANLAILYDDKYRELDIIKQDLSEIIKNEKEEIVLFLMNKIRKNILNNIRDSFVKNDFESHLTRIETNMHSKITQRLM